MKRSTGITLGRNVAVKFTGDTDYDRYLLHHETGHLSQINEMGATKFYSRTAKNIFVIYLVRMDFILYIQRLGH